jgi:hypothetical protein
MQAPCGAINVFHLIRSASWAGTFFVCLALCNLVCLWDGAWGKQVGPDGQ